MSRTIYLIHHTHTDVGYTEIQGRITDRQIDFIRQALDLVEDDGRFRWTCETFWAVEQFLRVATPEEEARFVTAVREGQIGLSASYLNYSELLDYETHRDLTGRVRAFGEAHGLRVASAMTADINGHAIGYAQALCDVGVENLFACVHTYHGMYPLDRNQTPFYWRMPDGKRLLVWSGDHYHLGNELGLVPGAFMTHMVNDALRPGDASLSVAERRVPRYLAKLEAEGYAYSFVPLMVSGLMTDNAPPTPTILPFLDAWNEKHGDEIRIELVTLDAFFERLRKEDAEIPEYEGLWPDWWVDLTVATPDAVQVFREGQRQLSAYRSLIALHPEAEVSGERQGVRRTEVEDAMALYAEHTFGHSATYTHPDHLLVAACLLRKSGGAAEVFEGAQRLMDRAAGRLGATRFRAGRPLRFRVLNPYETAYWGYAVLELDGFEWGSVDVSFEPPTVPVAVPGVEVLDAETKEILPAQAFQVPRGVQVRVHLTLGAGAARTLEVRRAERSDESPFLKVSELQGIDGARDVARPAACAVSEHALETPWVRIGWGAGGIDSWLDKRSGIQLLRPDRLHQAFTPVHEVSPGSPRTPMGRNRKGANVVRSAGRLVRVRGAAQGELLGTVLLDYDLPGARSCSVLLRAFVHEPIVEVEVAFHKDSCRDVESVYLPLPFRLGTDAAFWIDTSVTPLRPLHDQLPGTLTDFYHVHHGFGLVGRGFGVAVAMPDSPLLQLGGLEYGPRHLAGSPELEAEDPHPYAWLMNNFWETNANIDLAGFYRFRYAVASGPFIDTPEAAISLCRRLNQGLVTFRST